MSDFTNENQNLRDEIKDAGNGVPGGLQSGAHDTVQGARDSFQGTNQNLQGESGGNDILGRAESGQANERADQGFGQQGQGGEPVQGDTQDVQGHLGEATDSLRGQGQDLRDQAGDVRGQAQAGANDALGGQDARTQIGEAGNQAQQQVGEFRDQNERPNQF